ncbi:VOC family protein [Rhizobium leguminosarum]|uniref:VOC family protein n=1 Tax=Rhizobium TaxID=379 RepID=UPI001030D79D|nr:VOC family protein [Rhizobium leguminosarum]TBF87464.1 VOC family protein [Rhizobium leguminosarum]TBG07025.1 VOC family protein [Rhizobium leguminosarum]TBG07339.1 VOC family protein [Rhizobium leguminosarum]TBG30716.1 VOC family protein [Rhizobium leguminosarum]TBG49709.1 VOC family protein [Rhizobium leguminosarum]
MADFILPAKNTTSAFADVRGHHVAVRVPNRAEALKWYTEKLDWRVIHLWPFADEELAYIAPPNDDSFMVELLAGGEPAPLAAPPYTDLGDSLRHCGYHHFCLVVSDIEASVAEFRKRGVKIVTEPFQLDDISRKLAFIADPFGNLIELAEVLP